MCKMDKTLILPVFYTKRKQWPMHITFLLPTRERCFSQRYQNNTIVLAVNATSEHSNSSLPHNSFLRKRQTKKQSGQRVLLGTLVGVHTCFLSAVLVRDLLREWCQVEQQDVALVRLAGTEQVVCAVKTVHDAQNAVVVDEPTT